MRTAPRGTPPPRSSCGPSEPAPRVGDRVGAAVPGAADRGLAAPKAELEMSVVVPARDEEAHIACCLDALAGQMNVAHDRYEVLLVLDSCTDDTEGRAIESAAAHPELCLHLLEGPGRGTGGARRTGMEAACDRLLAVGRPDGLIASTDADSVVAPDWVAAQLAAAATGAKAIGGRVEISAEERAALPEGVPAMRDELARARWTTLLQGVGDEEAELSEHWQFSGASLALTAATYVDIGGLEPRPALEDEALERALRSHGIAIARPLSVRVTTSARTKGRAFRGLSRDLEVSSWLARRSFEGARYGLEGLMRLKSGTVTVILPARNVGETIGAVLAALAPARRRGLIDELIVVDAGSTDGTQAIAATHGVTVHQEDELSPEYGPARGKGDALWRGLAATSGDIVCYLDTDTHNFSADFVFGLLGPLFENPGIHLVKGSFRRPLRVGGAELSDEGGRVTELLARPFINLYLPELAGFVQPLAGEMAARRSLLESISFPVGYGVEIAVLIDALRLEGIDALAQVDLGVRYNTHQPLSELGAMAYAVLAAASARVHGADAIEAFAPGPFVLPGRDRFGVRQIATEERPPLNTSPERAPRGIG